MFTQSKFLLWNVMTKIVFTCNVEEKMKLKSLSHSTANIIKDRTTIKYNILYTTEYKVVLIV